MSPMAEAARTRRLPPGLRRDLLGGLLMLAVDVVAPVAGYYLLRAAGVEPVPALLLSGIPPAVRVLARLVRGRRPDALGLIVLGVIALSSIAAAFSGTARTLLVRNAIVGFPFALWTLASARAKRPLTYDVALSLLPSREESLERAWNGSAIFRGVWRRLAIIWGIGGLIGAAGSLAIALLLPIDAVPGVDTAFWIVNFAVLQAITQVMLHRSGAMRMVFAPA